MPFDPKELPPRQREVYYAALVLGGDREEVSVRAITKSVEPDTNEPAKAMQRTRSVVAILKKKELVVSENGRPDLIRVIIQPLQNIIIDESHTLKTATPSPSDPIQVKQSPLCSFHQSQEEAEHDFAIEILSEFTKLSRASQKKLWLIIAELMADLIIETSE